MLARLSIRDIVLIDRLDIDFARGLSVLTGETGAGKSILLDAFALALARAATSRWCATAPSRPDDRRIRAAGRDPARALMAATHIPAEGRIDPCAACSFPTAARAHSSTTSR